MHQAGAVVGADGQRAAAQGPEGLGEAARLGQPARRPADRGALQREAGRGGDVFCNYQGPTGTGTVSCSRDGAQDVCVVTDILNDSRRSIVCSATSPTQFDCHPVTRLRVGG